MKHPITALLLLLLTYASGQAQDLTAGETRVIDALKQYPKSTLLAICHISVHYEEVERLYASPDDYRNLTAEEVNALQARTSPEVVMAIYELLEFPEVVAILASHPIKTEFLGRVYQEKPWILHRWIARVMAERNEAEYGLQSEDENPAMEDEVATLYQNLPETYQDGVLYTSPAAIEYVLTHIDEFPNTLATILLNAENIYNEQIAAWVEAIEEYYGIVYEVGSAYLFVEQVLLCLESGLMNALWEESYEVFEYILDHLDYFPNLVGSIQEALRDLADGEARRYLERYQAEHPHFDPQVMEPFRVQRSNPAQAPNRRPPHKPSNLGPKVRPEIEKTKKQVDRFKQEFQQNTEQLNRQIEAAKRDLQRQSIPRPQPPANRKPLYQPPKLQKNHATNPFSGSIKKPNFSTKSNRIQSGAKTHKNSWSKSTKPKTPKKRKE